MDETTPTAASPPAAAASAVPAPVVAALASSAGVVPPRRRRRDRRGPRPPPGPARILWDLDWEWIDTAADAHDEQTAGDHAMAASNSAYSSPSASARSTRRRLAAQPSVADPTPGASHASLAAVAATAASPGAAGASGSLREARKMAQELALFHALERKESQRAAAAAAAARRKGSTGSHSAARLMASPAKLPAGRMGMGGSAANAHNQHAECAVLRSLTHAPGPSDATVVAPASVPSGFRHARKHHPSLSLPPASHAAALRSIPHCPVLRPSWAEFQDAMGYLAKVSREYSEQYGCVKIVPPKGWRMGYGYKFQPSTAAAAAAAANSATAAASSTAASSAAAAPGPSRAAGAGACSSPAAAASAAAPAPASRSRAPRFEVREQVISKPLLTSWLHDTPESDAVPLPSQADADADADPCLPADPAAHPAVGVDCARTPSLLDFHASASLSAQVMSRPYRNMSLRAFAAQGRALAHQWATKEKQLLAAQAAARRINNSHPTETQPAAGATSAATSTHDAAAHGAPFDAVPLAAQENDAQNSNGADGDAPMAPAPSDVSVPLPAAIPPPSATASSGPTEPEVVFASDSCAPSPRDPWLAAELSYWNWVYANDKPRTCYASDVELRDEFRCVRLAEPQQSHTAVASVAEAAPVAPTPSAPSSWPLRPRRLCRAPDAADAQSSSGGVAFPSNEAPRPVWSCMMASMRAIVLDYGWLDERKRNEVEQRRMQLQQSQSHKAVAAAAAPSACPFCSSPSCLLLTPPSAWDVSALAWLPGGLLRYLGGSAPGVTEPMLYIGAHHSTFNVHNEDHYAYSCSYMHPMQGDEQQIDEQDERHTDNEATAAATAPAHSIEHEAGQDGHVISSSRDTSPSRRQSLDRDPHVDDADDDSDCDAHDHQTGEGETGGGSGGGGGGGGSAHRADDAPPVSSKKIWYAVSGRHACSLESLLHTHFLPGLNGFERPLSLLPRKSTLLSPALLLRLGVPVHKARHTPNTFICTFPQAYHWGWSESAGVNLTESVNFALPDWMVQPADESAAGLRPKQLQVEATAASPDARLVAPSVPCWNSGCGLKATRLYRLLHQQIVISHERLVLAMVRAALAAAQSRVPKRNETRSAAMAAHTSLSGIPIAPPPLCHELDVSFLRRVAAELAGLIDDEKRARLALRQSVAPRVLLLNAKGRRQSHQAERSQLVKGEDSADEEAADGTAAAAAAAQPLGDVVVRLSQRFLDANQRSETVDEAESSLPDAAAAASASASGPLAVGAAVPSAAARSLLSNVLCAICQTACTLSYIDCVCDAYQRRWRSEGAQPTGAPASAARVCCIRHPEAICPCGDAVVTWRYSERELHNLAAQLETLIRKPIVAARLPTVRVHPSDDGTRASRPTRRIKTQLPSPLQAEEPAHPPPAAATIATAADSLPTHTSTISPRIKLEPETDSPLQKPRSSVRRSCKRSVHDARGGDSPTACPELHRSSPHIAAASPCSVENETAMQVSHGDSAASSDSGSGSCKRQKMESVVAPYRIDSDGGPGVAPLPTLPPSHLHALYPSPQMDVGHHPLATLDPPPSATVAYRPARSNQPTHQQLPAFQPDPSGPWASGPIDPTSSSSSSSSSGARPDRLTPPAPHLMPDPCWLPPEPTRAAPTQWLPTLYPSALHHPSMYPSACDTSSFHAPQLYAPTPSASLLPATARPTTAESALMSHVAAAAPPPTLPPSLLGSTLLLSDEATNCAVELLRREVEAQERLIALQNEQIALRHAQLQAEQQARENQLQREIVSLRRQLLLQQAQSMQLDQCARMQLPVATRAYGRAPSAAEPPFATPVAPMQQTFDRAPAHAYLQAMAPMAYQEQAGQWQQQQQQPQQQYSPQLQAQQQRAHQRTYAPEPSGLQQPYALLQPHAHSQVF